MSNEILNVETDGGIISAQPSSDPDFPGIYLSIDGKEVALLEYSSLSAMKSLKVWDVKKDDDDFAYSQDFK